MQEYSWPGNIRELENVIKRSLILAKGNVITPELIGEEFNDPKETKQIAPNRIDTYLNESIQDLQGEVYKSVIEQVEKDLIEWAMKKTEGNQVQAAKLLGISRVMLHERIEKYGIVKG
jgi:DNA-binding NtrC family response regulator